MVNLYDNQTHRSHHGSRKQHSHSDHHDHGDMVNDFRKRFYISLIVTIPILIMSPAIQSFFYGGWPFIAGWIDELKDRNPGMMTLIGLAIAVAYVYSSFTVFGLQGQDFFWELATLIDIMLLGHWIEMRSVMGASHALEELIKLMPNEAHKLDEQGNIADVPLSALKHHDRVLVKPGEQVPVDGIILDGRSAIDESMLTGESVPAEKGKGDEVIGGSVNKEGSLTIQVEKTGDNSYLSQVITLVK